MEKYESDETFIARWVAGELSEEELSEFKKTDAYSVFNHINKESQKFKAPPADAQKALEKTKERIAFKKKGRVISMTWYAVAASIAILLGVVGLFTSTKSYTTSFGEQLAVTLPDGSKVQLNANSTLEHKRFFWNANRDVNLEGEAYFEVEKGGDFVVATARGEVSVLGTKFNIKTRAAIFEVNCFEGAVRFDKKGSEEYHILKANDKITLSENVVIDEKTKENGPNWMNGISVFKERPLQEVLKEIEIQYGVQFQTGNANVSNLFTGSFVHDDLEKALRSTLTPMGVSYTVSEDNTIVYLE